MRRLFPLIAVLLLTISAGCAGLNPLDSAPKTTAEKIEQNMKDVDSVQTRSEIIRNITVQQPQKTTITNYNREQTQSEINFTTNEYVRAGVGVHYFLGSRTRYQFEEYYSNETIYSRQRLISGNTTKSSPWNATESERNLTQTKLLTFADADFLKHFQPNKTLTTNSTIVYQINLLNDSKVIQNKLENDTFSPMDSQRKVLDEYVLQIYVNNSTYRLEQVRIYAYGNFTKEELETLSPAYKNVSSDNINARIGFFSGIQFRNYNESVNITVPEKAKSAT